ncbi:hypothetical protein SSX86_007664 [Deinandra increscens subsp. villosa]|uniref:Transposase, Ptta/En/Spm, plant n=2 Tax=Deinandra increscens subsp. villosa TaxID=3103831 RepID=A0AAP0DHS1_9ASTR
MEPENTMENNELRTMLNDEAYSDDDAYGYDSGEAYEDHNEAKISDSSDSDSEGSSDGETITATGLECLNPKKIKAKRGLTRLSKMKNAYTNSGGKKRRVKFDAYGRFSGRYNSEFISFLGDLVRENVGLSVFNWKHVSKELRDKLWALITCYYEVDEGRRKYVMNRLGMLLRSFRNKLYEKDILPNLGKPNKLAKIPRRYRTIIRNQEHWDNFVAYTQSDQYKAVSGRSKTARSMSIYNHRLGRGGYARLEQKLVESKVIDAGTMPSRSLLWYKARENKAGEIEDEAAKAIAAEIMKTEKKITDGQLKLDPGNDAMTVVLGKEKCGSLRGVGTGVNPSKFFNVPRQRGSMKQQLDVLQAQLEKEKQENVEKDEQINALNERMAENEKKLAFLLATLPPQGQQGNWATPANTSPAQLSPSITNVPVTPSGADSQPDMISQKESADTKVTPEAAKTRQNKAEAKKKDALTPVAVTTPSDGIIKVCNLTNMIQFLLHQ